MIYQIQKMVFSVTNQREYHKHFFLNQPFYLLMMITQIGGNFRDKLKNSKGTCLHHFADLCQGADKYLNDKEKAEFFPMIFQVMEENMERVSADIDWFIEKFDYLNKDADWKNSKDAVQRGMQKIRGGYPADPVYKMK